eukprot:15436448-Alexandrium_andersonii.AAC.1
MSVSRAGAVAIHWQGRLECFMRRVMRGYVADWFARRRLGNVRCVAGGAAMVPRCLSEAALCALCAGA